jgi:hypothetical protein
MRFFLEMICARNNFADFVTVWRISTHFSLCFIYIFVPEPTHLAFMYLERPEAYNGELVNDGEDDLDE